MYTFRHLSNPTDSTVSSIPLDHDSRITPHPSPSHNKIPKPIQIIPTPISVCILGNKPIRTASITATRPIVRRFATDEVVGPQIPIRIIRPAFCSISTRPPYAISTIARSSIDEGTKRGVQHSRKKPQTTIQPPVLPIPYPK